VTTVDDDGNNHRICECVGGTCDGVSAGCPDNCYVDAEWDGECSGISDPGSCYPNVAGVNLIKAVEGPNGQYCNTFYSVCDGTLTIGKDLRCYRASFGDS